MSPPPPASRFNSQPRHEPSINPHSHAAAAAAAAMHDPLTAQLLQDMSQMSQYSNFGGLHNSSGGGGGSSGVSGGSLNPPNYRNGMPSSLHNVFNSLASLQNMSSHLSGPPPPQHINPALQQRSLSSPHHHNHSTPPPHHPGRLFGSHPYSNLANAAAAAHLGGGGDRSSLSYDERGLLYNDPRNLAAASPSPAAAAAVGLIHAASNSSSGGLERDHQSLMTDHAAAALLRNFADSNSGNNTPYGEAFKS